MKFKHAERKKLGASHATIATIARLTYCISDISQTGVVNFIAELSAIKLTL
jgi:hypothetical protein